MEIGRMLNTTVVKRTSAMQIMPSGTVVHQRLPVELEKGTVMMTLIALET